MNKLKRRKFFAILYSYSSRSIIGINPIYCLWGVIFQVEKCKAYIPTRAGGGADRNFRAFSGVWSKHLGIKFEPKFYPGASGRVGYETYG